MTESTMPASFDEAQIDRLEELLDDPALGDAMRLDEIQGYLCAAISGPRPIDEEDRLIDILGREDALDTEAGREAAALIRRFAEALAADLAAGAPPALLLYPKNEDEEDGPSDYQAWCEAYLMGVDQAAEDWFEGLEAEGSPEAREQADYLDERLFPLMALTGEAEAAARAHGEDWPEGEERAALERECEDDLPQAVADIHCFWLARRGTAPIRNESPKIGRNAPCPCGSGKKYKHCCGEGV
ncbi:MAG: UPF0149 family protein [Candidatus Accumulibacter sp.]|jgi:uncharacterized protein|nr:UPF0149 family protein [Accumulibacter sp.]